MNTVIQLSEPDERTAKQKAFRRKFADNFGVALDRRGAIPSGYGRVIGVAELFGVSQNTAANWIKGDGVPELSRLPEIAEILGTTIEQLVLGERELGPQIIDEDYVMVDMHEEDSLEGCAWYTLPDTLRSVGLPNEIKMLQVSGDDMTPYINGGDVVAYDPRVKRIQSNGVFVLQVNGRFVVRRVQRGVKQNVRLICDNPLFGEEILDETEIAEGFVDDSRPAAACRVIGRVVGRLLVGN